MNARFHAGARLVRRAIAMTAAAAACGTALHAHAQQGNPFAAIQSQLQALQQNIDALHQKIDALPDPAGMVPFAVQAAGGLCDSGPSPSSNPEILVEGTGANRFVVTSILIKTAPQGPGQEGYMFLTANSVQIDGTLFDTRTGNLVASSDGSAVQESADLMGASVRIAPPTSLQSSPRTESPAGGNFPHQIVADSAGANDIRVRLFCRSDDFDLGIDTVRVSGWRSPEDTIAVTYVPGS